MTIPNLPIGLEKTGSQVTVHKHASTPYNLLHTISYKAELTLNHNRTPTRIFFVGPMGAGKTTIGGKLAENLGMQFIDLDHEIEQKTGADIPLIFELEGEAGFRKRETQIFEELSNINHLVLATGGGAIISKKNRDILKKTGLVIYLRAPIDQLLKRTAKDRNRPLLQTSNPRLALATLLEQREPFYEDVADMTVETDQKLLRDIVHEITQSLISVEKK